jgi:hypothetical protein
MNIEITKEEYPILVELLYMAERVLTGHKTESDPRSERYEKVVQKFYALAEKQGPGGLVEYDPDLKKYFPGRTVEEASEARKFLSEFADETFWHELMYRFTDRDLERQLGGHENVRKLNMEERFELETPIEEKYAEEFEQHGLDRLEIVERFGPAIAQAKTSD